MRIGYLALGRDEKWSRSGRKSCDPRQPWCSPAGAFVRAFANNTPGVSLRSIGKVQANGANGRNVNYPTAFSSAFQCFCIAPINPASFHSLARLPACRNIFGVSRDQDLSSLRPSCRSARYYERSMQIFRKQDERRRWKRGPVNAKLASAFLLTCE